MVAAILGGHVHGSFLFGGEGGQLDNIQRAIDGGGRLLAMSSEKREKGFPDVPTLKERGIRLWQLHGPGME